MKFNLLISFLIFLAANSLKAQNKSADYHPPLDIPLILSSNFGELRPNHFHMGLDFKTNNRIGYNLYCIEEGFVSRIKVSPYGYGKVVYIDHPNGITSVYAHCSAFVGQVDSIVKATQEKEQDFAIEVFPKPNQIRLKKGEVFALSGNTGGSTAPHLHFELRDTKTEAALNPLIFGFDIADHKAPEIRGVKVYSLTKEGYRYPGKAVSRTARKGASSYSISEGKITIPASYTSKTGGIGIAVDVIDRLDGAGNQCGLYGSILMVNGDTIFGQKTDRVPFESTRFVNCHKDYEAYVGQRKKYHKCFRTNENDLPIYIDEANGVINVNPGDLLKVHYIAFDPKGNRSELKFNIEVSKGTINSADNLPIDLTYLQPGYPMSLETEQRQLEFGRSTVYEPMKLKREKIDTHVGEAPVPVHKAYRIKVKSQTPNDGKNYLEMISAKGRRRTMQLEYKDGWYYTDSKYFGSYKLRRDETPPTVSPISFSNSTTSTALKTIKWRIGDQHTGLADYDLFIDGKWYLLEYEYKGSYVTFKRPSNVVGSKEVVVRVEDKCGNVTEWKRTIVFR